MITPERLEEIRHELYQAAGDLMAVYTIGSQEAWIAIDEIKNAARNLSSASLHLQAHQQKGMKQ